MGKYASLVKGLWGASDDLLPAAKKVAGPKKPRARKNLNKDEALERRQTAQAYAQKDAIAAKPPSNKPGMSKTQREEALMWAEKEGRRPRPSGVRARGTSTKTKTNDARTAKEKQEYDKYSGKGGDTPKGKDTPKNAPDKGAETRRLRRRDPWWKPKSVSDLSKTGKWLTGIGGALTAATSADKLYSDTDEFNQSLSPNLIRGAFGIDPEKDSHLTRGLKRAGAWGADMIGLNDVADVAPFVGRGFAELSMSPEEIKRARQFRVDQESEKRRAEDDRELAPLIADARQARADRAGLNRVSRDLFPTLQGDGRVLTDSPNPPLSGLSKYESPNESLGNLDPTPQHFARYGKDDVYRDFVADDQGGMIPRFSDRGGLRELGINPQNVPLKPGTPAVPTSLAGEPIQDLGKLNSNQLSALRDNLRGAVMMMGQQKVPFNKLPEQYQKAMQTVAPFMKDPTNPTIGELKSINQQLTGMGTTASNVESSAAKTASASQASADKMFELRADNSKLRGRIESQFDKKDPQRATAASRALDTRQRVLDTYPDMSKNEILRLDETIGSTESAIKGIVSSLSTKDTWDLFIRNWMAPDVEAGTLDTFSTAKQMIDFYEALEGGGSRQMNGGDVVTLSDLTGADKARFEKLRSLRDKYPQLFDQ